MWTRGAGHVRREAIDLETMIMRVSKKVPARMLIRTFAASPAKNLSTASGRDPARLSAQRGFSVHNGIG